MMAAWLAVYSAVATTPAGCGVLADGQPLVRGAVWSGYGIMGIDAGPDQSALAPSRTMADAMETFESSDGTVIAFERSGDGPSVVLVGGALTDRSSARDLARLLAPTCTVYCYDRRGRGSSGDSPPYEADLEVEDLEALIIHVAGTASVFGVGTGGSLVLRAATEGVALDRIAVYEPPYIVDDSRPHPSPDLPARVRGMIAGGRAGDAVERYLVEEAAVSPAMVARLQAGPEWATMEALAPTITHDIAIIGDGSMPDGLGVDQACRPSCSMAPRVPSGFATPRAPLPRPSPVPST